MWCNKRGGGRCTQETHSGRVGCLLVLSSLDFRLSVISVKISVVLSVMHENIKTMYLPSRIFSRFVFMREISTPEL